MPAGFWNDFHKELITKNESNQGPWGGKREIYWKIKNKNTFTEKEIIEFTSNNDWILKHVISFKSDSLNPTSFDKLKLDDYSLYLLTEKVIPKLRTNDYSIFIFNTSIIAIESGDLGETYENGFAVLNSNKTELKVFHFWGE